ncbi:hypothetical protein EVAR_33346_1 [Eumeta japonica]|uniref:Uncharacterized protein n=1 Tax=Eumeta variegata TaxID=151549 RepID=A0A4C1YIU5_EUMVA|nr:hypothetical protein EVAR_33346_1 [Eumeta japonica]
MTSAAPDPPSASMGNSRNGSEYDTNINNITVRRTKLCRSELAANDILRRYYVPRPRLLLRRVPVLRHCDAFVTSFTAAKFRAL